MPNDNLRPTSSGHFRLSGDFDPDEITARIGVQPSCVLRTGDIHPDSGRPSGASYWWLRCADDADGDVSDQIISLIVKLRGVSQAVSELSAKFDGTMELVAYLDGNYPGFFLMASLVKDLASLNVDLDCKYIYASQNSSREANDAN
jgi:hypothetical protein